MRKKHLKPEFQVISQETANAKFFVASDPNYYGNPPSTGSTPPDGSASQYDEGNGLDF